MFDNTSVTRSSQTDKAYEDRAELLFTNYQILTGKNWKSSPSEFCHWFKQRAFDMEWSASTVKQYRAALNHVMWINNFYDEMELLLTIKTSLFKSKGNATSSNKQKSFPPKDLAKVLAQLSNKTKWDALLKCWLQAGIITGLRPAEWSSAKRVLSLQYNPVDEWGALPENSEGLWLIIKNAKDSNERANGSYRALNLAALTTAEIKIIDAMLLLIPKDRDDYTEAYNGCRKRLSVLTKKIWPRRKKRPSLYSVRHQFRANASSAGQTLEQIAALMGHATNETASKHYGYAKWGSGSQPVLPHPENEMTVRCVYGAQNDNSPQFT